MVLRVDGPSLCKSVRRDGIFFGVDEGGGRGGNGVASLITADALNGGVPCRGVARGPLRDPLSLEDSASSGTELGRQL